jgi:hypothetical protein
MRCHQPPRSRLPPLLLLLLLLLLPAVGAPLAPAGCDSSGEISVSPGRS